MASSLGIFHTLTGLIMILAGGIAGCLWHYIGFQALFIYSSVMSLFAVLLFVMFGRLFK